MDSVSLIPGLRERHSFAFIHVVLSQLSIAINTSSSSAGQCITIPKHRPGKDFYFHGDGIMFFSGRLTADNMSGCLCICCMIHISLSTCFPLFTPPPVSTSLSAFMITFFLPTSPICPSTPFHLDLRCLSQFPLQNLFIVTLHFPARLSSASSPGEMADFSHPIVLSSWSLPRGRISHQPQFTHPPCRFVPD